MKETTSWQVKCSKRSPSEPDDELQRTLRQDVGLDHDPHGGFGEIGRGACRLNDGGDAGQKRGRQLFQHAPDREVERVDVDGHALQRRVDVQALKRAAAREAFDAAVDQDAIVGQFAAAFRLIDGKRADSAVDVDPGIAFGGARLIAEFVEILLASGESLRECLEHQGPLVERECPQGGASLLPRKASHPREVEATRRRQRDHVACDGGTKFGEFARAGHPTVFGVILQCDRRHASPSLNSDCFVGHPGL